MNRKSILSLFLLLSLLLSPQLTACSASSDDDDMSAFTNTDTTETDAVVTEGYLYSFAVDNGETITITLPEDPEYNAELHTADLDGSGTMNRIVLHCIGHGTGVWLEEARVFDGDTGDEFPVMSVSEVIEKHIGVTATEESWILTISGIDHKIDKSQFADYTPEEIYETPNFSMSHNFTVENGQLYCKVGILCAGPATGYAKESLLIRYGYENGAIVPVEITFRTAEEIVGGVPTETVLTDMISG